MGRYSICSLRARSAFDITAPPWTPRSSTLRRSRTARWNGPSCVRRLSCRQAGRCFDNRVRCDRHPLSWPEWWPGVQAQQGFFVCGGKRSRNTMVPRKKTARSRSGPIRCLAYPVSNGLTENDRSSASFQALAGLQISVSSTAVTCRSAASDAEQQLLDLTNAHSRPERLVRSSA